jgi:hypothetical protein
MTTIVNIVKNPLYGKVYWNGTNFVYTPDVGFTGRDYYIYTITNGITSQILTNYVESTNVAPSANDIYFTGNVNELITIDISSHISDPDNLVSPLKIVDLSEPFYGTATYEGSKIYYKSYGFNSEDNLIYTISDGQYTATAMIYLSTVNGTNIKYPKSVLDKMSNLEYDITVLANISSNWDSAYTIISSNSANWMSLDATKYNNASNIIQSHSADWVEIYQNKSLYDDSKNTVASYSALWVSVANTFDSVSTILQTYSGDWEVAYSILSLT